MSGKQVRQVVVQRVRLREDLKPLKTYWHAGSVQPDWLFITHVTGPKHDSFDLHSVKAWPAADQVQPARASLTGYVSYETLRIAKDQAHAELGVEYVEWDSCNVEITNPDGSIDWGRAVPCAELGIAGTTAPPGG